jgi:hypothetical protein
MLSKKQSMQRDFNSGVWVKRWKPKPDPPHDREPAARPARLTLLSSPPKRSVKRSNTVTIRMIPMLFYI